MQKELRVGANLYEGNGGLSSVFDLSFFTATETITIGLG